MFSRYTEPLPHQFETPEEYLEEFDAWRETMQAREDYLVERRCEREQA